MKRTRQDRQTGIALITALLVLLLITSLVVGFSWLVMSDQTMGSNTATRQNAFYGAEGGMEQLTSALNNLFGQNYAPTDAQVNALFAPGTDPASNPATGAIFQGVSFVDPTLGTPGSGYSISYASSNGTTPDASIHQITAGAYQGLTGLITPYTLNVIAQFNGGGEVKLQRTVQTVGIPLFEFGIFSQTDLSFFAGPNFNFGGRIHTNGNLFLAEGDGSTLTLGDKVTAVGEVIRTNLSNGWNTNAGYNGPVNVLTAPGSFRALASTEGSLTGTLGSAANPGWQNISIGTYHSYLRDGDQDPPLYTGVNSTGATPLNLTIATPSLGGTPIDLIRRPIAGELASNAPKLGERYFASASLRILLSDNPADITSLPCVSATPPIDLSAMAQAPGPAGGNWTALSPSLAAVVAAANVNGTQLVPLAASGAGASYSSNDGYWVAGATPVITGYLKIDAQTSYGTPCGTYQDVTAEILGLGYAGRNLNPQTAPVPPQVPGLPVSEIGPSNCADPHPNAVIRIERVRDNPSTQSTGAGCGVAAGLLPPNATDYWPNALFDSREGNPRDWCPNGGGGPCHLQPTLGGVMYYVELDVNNLARWFTGAIGQTGAATKDPSTAPNDFSVFFSDRRGNFTTAPNPSGWPPVSPSGNETGEFGFNDWINPGNNSGCPNASNPPDPGEAFDAPQDNTLQTYGAQPAPYPFPATPGGPYAPQSLFNLMTGGFNSLNNSAASALQPNWNCANPGYVTSNPAVWPGWYVRNTVEARENPPLFFRRALKLVNGSVLNLGTCPNGVNCGLTIASENPVYMQGNYNCGSVGCTSFAPPYGAAAVITDAFTFLSNEWNDVNSFTSTYDVSSTPTRNAGFAGSAGTWYRVAVAAGKGISFPQPPGTGQDFGTDGGVHNFLRYIENWGGAALNYRGSIVSLYYDRQATGVFKCCSTVYSPPNRGYVFDTDFLTPALLPPRTPMFRTVNTIGFTQYLLPSIQ